MVFRFLEYLKPALYMDRSHFAGLQAENAALIAQSNLHFAIILGRKATDRETMPRDIYARFVKAFFCSLTEIG